MGNTTVTAGLAFPGESILNLPWKKSQYDNTIVKTKQNTHTHTHTQNEEKGSDLKRGVVIVHMEI